MFKTIKNLHRTFYSSAFYNELTHAWKGIGIGFLFIIALVCSINSGRTLVTNSEAIFNEEYVALFEALPALKISSGVIEIDGETQQSFLLQGNPSLPKLTISFDMTEAVPDTAATTHKMHTENIFILVTKKAINVQDLATGQINVEEIAKMKDITVSHEDWIQLGQAFKQLFVPLGTISAFGLFSVFSLVLVVIGGIAVFILSPLSKLNIPYSACMRLAAAAGFPVAVIFSFIQMQIILVIVLWFGFVFFGLLSARNGQMQRPKPPLSPH